MLRSLFFPQLTFAPESVDQVIEKAYKKLRLDALVIQQGRLVENTKGVNKEDLLSMVRYGAELVFSAEVRVWVCKCACFVCVVQMP